MTLRRDWIGSPNYSSRASGVRLVVLHTAEGALTYQSLGNYFASSNSGVSSHVGIDDTPGVIGEYVRRDLKAWTQGNANPYSVAAELCAFAAWSPGQWAQHQTMLSNTAAWIAEEAAAFGIPIVRLSASQAQDGHSKGVCQHADLGAAGGGHWDCGPGFPMDDVLALAGKGPGTPAPTQRKERNMIASTSTGDGYWTVTHDGAVSAFGDAQYEGGGFSPDVMAGDVVGIAGKGTDGYWILADDGGVFAFGSAQYHGRPDRV